MSSNPAHPAQPDLGWILNDLVQHPGARHAVILSADGLARYSSEGVDAALSDTISAASSGLHSLSNSAAPFVSDTNTAWRQTMVQFADGFLFIVAAGDGSFLAASATAGVDIAAFSYRMGEVVKRMGAELGVDARQAEQG